MQKGIKPRRGHEVRGTQVSWATNLRGPDFHPRDDLFQQNFCGLNPGRGRAGSWHAGSWHVEVRGKSIPIAVQLYAVQLYINGEVRGTQVSWHRTCVEPEFHPRDGSLSRNPHSPWRRTEESRGAATKFVARRFRGPRTCVDRSSIPSRRSLSRNPHSPWRRPEETGEKKGMIIMSFFSSSSR